jgi:CBS domain-containing protein
MTSAISATERHPEEDTVATPIRDLMTPDPVTCSSSTTVQEAAQLMRDDDIGDILVEDQGELRGIVTDRDLVVRVLAENVGATTVSIGAIFSGDLHTLTPDDDLDDAVELLRDHAVRRVPIVENGAAVGILAIGDLAVLRDQASALADISASLGNT